ncbi:MULTISPECIES: hypothetical protein [unclassified Lentimonas]|uniref:HD domain-containing protein n=1 Tax=unclassified Lentimonas TaxID=2630993 RepID=UPI00132A2A0A|nr:MULTISPECIES: hypothetical protein [unclassified Lentimonas]CAA6692639.1 Unannotated [Lentimonas sp. CC19]CAA6696981.1 Unannotated [Lentimonas sp. CC10]CAA7071005.1 Unannotated [Lentimonas sp. CC11]
MSNTTRLPLEEYFLANAKNPEAFPHATEGYGDRYNVIKEYMKTEVYPHIGTGATLADGGIYTDHSIKHFEAVIRYAGKLLAISPEDTFIGNEKLPINPYEVYLLLVSILLHDAGMIFKRSGHPKRANAIMKSMGPLAFTDSFERMEVAKITAAHGGEVVDKATGIITKDTIGQPDLKEDDALGGILFRPKLLAAIVRFSDEICEDRSRAGRFMIENDVLPEHSVIFHRYAHSISNVSVDHLSKTVRIEYRLLVEDVKSQYGKNIAENGEIEKEYIIDEISERLEKMYHELIYCRNFMYQVVDLRSIRAAIEIIDDSGDFPAPVETQTIEIKQEGFPEGHFSIKNKYPDWNGASVVAKLNESINS